MNETIAAIATPPGEGAIAILRLSGNKAVPIADKIFRGKTKPSLMKSRQLYFGKIIRESETIDEVLLSIFRAPESYTGEDVVEISGHGGALVARRVLETALEAGARLARPGEFTQRAYLHGKIDLTKAEAIMDLITAQTVRAQRAATEQLSGRLGDEMVLLRENLLAAVAHLEAFLDFPEEDISPATGHALRAHLEENRQHLLRLLSTADEGRVLREGMRLALCGAPNAGKSSLLNRLLGIDRAIVSNVPGTTRDTIEEIATLGGFPFRLVDTAGLRLTDDLVEQEGVRRAEEIAASADLALHIVDAKKLQEPISSIATNELLVLNKIDLIDSAQDRLHLENNYPTAIPISCATGEGIEVLVKTIIERVTSKKPTPTEAPLSSVTINARHTVCLARALQFLNDALQLFDTEQPPELLATELHAALDAIGEVVGTADTEEILGEIFGQFCIGK
ncbi:MAG: tRNA uridine-5-carboxymethylaminomethyl(34) synthesis GTPase MnmE [Chthoniobacterales bacterium]